MNRGALWAFAAVAFAVVAAYSQPATVQVDITPGHAINSFDPDSALGSSIDVLSRTGIDNVYTPHIVQEALGNVHRHSGSATTSVRLSTVDGGMHLEISDEGRGIPAERQRELASHGGGVGLRGMRERVGQFGGEFRIDPAQKGVTIRVVFPQSRQATSAGQ